MRPYFKFIVVLSVALSLTACLGKRAAEAENNYRANYGGYLASQSDCFRDNKHTVEFVPEGATAPVKMELAAGDCDGVDQPQHGGEFVAQTESAIIQAGGNVLAAGINAVASIEISDDNNDTRVRIAELQNEREAAENALLAEAISTNQSQTESITEQNVALTELVESLTGEDEETEGEESENGEAPEDGVADEV